MVVTVAAWFEDRKRPFTAEVSWQIKEQVPSIQ